MSTQFVWQERLTKFVGVRSSDATPIDNPGRRSDSRGNGFREVGSDIGMGGLSLSRGGDFASTDSPNGLVGDYDFAEGTFDQRPK